MNTANRPAVSDLIDRRTMSSVPREDMIAALFNAQDRAMIAKALRFYAASSTNSAGAEERACRALSSAFGVSL